MNEVKEGAIVDHTSHKVANITRERCPNCRCLHEQLHDLKCLPACGQGECHEHDRQTTCKFSACQSKRQAETVQPGANTEAVSDSEKG